MDPEIQEAISTWLACQMREHKGPGDNVRFSMRGAENSWSGYGTPISNILREIVPTVAEEIIQENRSGEGFHDTWPRLSDRVIGVLMKAGAAKFLPALIPE